MIAGLLAWLYCRLWLWPALARYDAPAYCSAPLGPSSLQVLGDMHAVVTEHLELNSTDAPRGLSGKLFYLPCELVASILNLWWNWDEGYLLIDPPIGSWETFFHGSFGLLVCFLLSFSEYQERAGLGLNRVVSHTETEKGSNK